MALNKIKNLADLVKFSHTIFALPFALASMLIAANGLPSLRTVILILLCMITARNAAMAFNRYLDADIDAKNPRTANRHLPQGIFSKKFVLIFALINAALFIFLASQLNSLCFILSIPVVGLLFFYSFMKRFSHWSHLVLGLALGIAPSGAWMAVRGSLSVEPIVLSLAVLLWVAGFDIIYATQDYEFDRREGLHSLVARFGIGKALTLSRFFHVVTVILLFLFGRLVAMGWIYNVSLISVTSLLFYEQTLVKEKDLSRVNAAFFNVNGFISLLFLAGVILTLP